MHVNRLADLLSLLSCLAPIQALPTGSVAAAEGSISPEGLQIRSSVFSNDTIDRFTGWTSGSTTRGTLNIISSCIITLVLCIWTTVHVNLDAPKPVKAARSQDSASESPSAHPTGIFVLIERAVNTRLFRKLLWGFMTLLLPEATLTLAVYERKTARLIVSNCEKYKENKGSGSSSASKKEKKPEWNTQCAFFAVMGGFALKENLKLPGDEKQGERRTLTAWGVVRLVQEGILKPNPMEIQDKSKADTFAKLIVLYQALWMVVQSFGRVGAHLPVTLLEMHTCLHTYCALVMYLIWWEKPLNVELAIEVVLDAQNEAHNDIIKEFTSTSLPSLEQDPTDPFRRNWPFSTSNNANSGPEQDPTAQEQVSSPRALNTNPYLISRAGLGKIASDLSHNNWNLGKNWIDGLAYVYKNLGDTRRHTWKEGAAVAAVILVYGGLHLLGWTSRFPTEAERILWQIAAAVTAAGWSLFLLLVWLCAMVASRKPEPTWVHYLFAWVTAVSLLLIMSARLYMLFELFFSLRRVDPQVYRVPIWSNMWPHAG